MTWYTREEAEPSEDYGERPQNRSVEQLLESGFVVVDKPFGPTSSQVSNWVKENLDLEKTGHFGTLDPNATGVLPVGLNSGTRMQRVLASSGKTYVFEVEADQDVDEQGFMDALNGKVGGNLQVPPEKSAVRREERERELKSAELLEHHGDSFLCRIEVESGFYVRVLVEQLGEELDAELSMPELRRTEQGHLDESDAETLQRIVDAYEFFRDGDKSEIRDVLRPVEEAARELPKLVIKDSAVNAVANGANLSSTGVSRLESGIGKGDKVAIMTLKGELVALATARENSERIYTDDVEAADLDSVHMDPEKYPRRWNG